MTRWKKAILGISLFVLWFVGLILFGSENLESQYFWVTGSLFAIIVGVAPFWRYRAKTWFWLTNIFLVVVSAICLFHLRAAVAEPDLPSKGMVQLLFVVVCLASWAIMLAVHYMLYRKFLWQIPSAPTTPNE